MEENKEHNNCLDPHESLFFVLSYLPLFDLLCMSRVCKSMRNVINCDILPWLEIKVDRPLSSIITDDVLMKVVSKAKGKLRVLALINCVQITDDGLLRIIAQNPNICKLHVQGCTNLSPNGVITAVKLLTNNNHILQSLKINGIYNIQKEDLKVLNNLITPNQTQQRPKHPSIDVDICPKCDDVRMVFDCTRVLCKCRGCEFCIQRCKECGVCIRGNDEELEEVACEDTLCLQCWLKLPKCRFCNKPYCNAHVYKQHRISGSSGFICDSCYSKFT
ncbi:hypothetical protein RD792_011363 [Penstemon davidsonii]|uniref:F-box domain-containing protein n=1 Tax=Penstemon davidsonii TaxID=160366 RepID=A0ABR0D4E1_9LAMI|nr:hypothetical protein RD792_011363 [Penstemon davidsonii]